MKQYLVTWSMDQDAASPEDAARQALATLLDPYSIATVFSVYDNEQPEQTATEVDLGETLVYDSENEHERFDFEQWVTEVVQRNTCMSYDQWVRHQLYEDSMSAESDALPNRWKVVDRSGDYELESEDNTKLFTNREEAYAHYDELTGKDARAARLYCCHEDEAGELTEWELEASCFISKR